MRSATGPCKSDHNGEVIILQWANLLSFAPVEYNLGRNKGDRNGEVTLLVRCPY